MGIISKEKIGEILQKYYVEHYGERETDVWFEQSAVNVWVFKRDGIYGNINLDKICKEVNYGKTYICTRFKAVMGYSVMEYVNILKIAEAKKLIREKNHNFMQISNMLNFNNPHYFSKVFKKITGLSPREYMNTVNI